MKKYFYLTPLVNGQAVLQEGIHCDNEGQILVFDDHSAIINVAVNKIAAEFSLFEISKSGITGKIEPYVAVSSVIENQFKITQEKIPADSLNYLGNFTLTKEAIEDYFKN